MEQFNMDESRLMARYAGLTEFTHGSARRCGCCGQILTVRMQQDCAEAEDGCPLCPDCGSETDRACIEDLLCGCDIQVRHAIGSRIVDGACIDLGDGVTLDTGRGLMTLNDAQLFVPDSILDIVDAAVQEEFDGNIRAWAKQAEE